MVVRSSFPLDVPGSSVLISCSAASQTPAFLLDACDKMENFLCVFLHCRSHALSSLDFLENGICWGYPCLLHGRTQPRLLEMQDWEAKLLHTACSSGDACYL